VSASSQPTDPTNRQGIAAAILLAAGGGTRMKSRTIKMLHEIGGRSLISYVINAVEGAHPERIVAVVGHQADQVTEHLKQVAPAVEIAHQPRRGGTGDAARIGLEALNDLDGEVLVTITDMPLLTAETLAGLVDAHRSAGSVVTFLSADVADPTGYGRIVRDAGGRVTGIVEHRDATPEQQAITEINSGVGLFDAAVLRDLLPRLQPSGSSGELYLTEILGLAAADGLPVAAHRISDSWQTEGVNTRVQLSVLGRELNRRICEHWMLEGVTIVDPETTWIHADVDIAPDVTLLPGTSLEGTTVIGTGAVIGPDTTLRDVEVGEDAVVCRVHGSLAVIGPNAEVGPYAYLRPGTLLEAGGKIGTFVEVKNSRIGAGTKVPHLSYVGDAEIGEGSNVGAGTIFANYDGVEKHRSTVGRHSFIGSDTVLVAPVHIADGVYVAAGSAITDDVGAGELGIARGRQHNSAGWVARNRAGTKTAEAAAAADQQPRDHEGDQP
jgi:bifunctional UDP-N-acetylglucosamine pyrophosphorylase/glucosamine-1-phosphate N-acetyltransferase